VGAEGKAESVIVKDFALWSAWNSNVKPYGQALSTEAVDNTVDELGITGCVPHLIAALVYLYKKQSVCYGYINQ